MSLSVGDRVLTYGVCLLGSWTLFCYGITLADAGFSLLLGWWLVPVVVGLVLGALCAGRIAYGAPSIRQAQFQSILTSSTTWRTIFPLFVVPAVTIVLQVFDASYWAVWLGMLIASVLVFRATSTSGANLPQSIKPSIVMQQGSLIALMFLGALLVALTHRPDLDDAQYLNFVVTPIDFPLEPLYSRSGLWQDPSVPLELPVYRLHTYELLVAALSHILGVDHKFLYYLILAPVFGAVAVLVNWRLACYLTPRRALSVVITWLVFIIALGESHRELGNFSFVRLYQGKAILVTVALPLCLLLGLRFADLPDWRRGLTLGMAVIASVGMSSSALATVPFVVAAGLSGGLRGASRAFILRIVLGGLVSLCFLVAIGVVLLMAMKLGIKTFSFDSLPSADSGISTVLGNGALGTVIVALFPLAPLFIDEIRPRRLYAMTTLFFVIVVLNPWTAPWLGTVLDSALLWRLFWSVPFLISAAISLTALVALFACRLPVAARPLVLVIALAAVLLSSDRWSISPDNAVVISNPRYKVVPNDHEIAAEIVRRAPPRSTIYAPISIAHLITTFRLHPYPLVVRPEYLGFEKIRNHFGDAELVRRRRVIEFLEGIDRHPSTAPFFQLELARDRPTLVVYHGGVATAPQLSSALSVAGYVSERRGSYWLWQFRDGTRL